MCVNMRSMQRPYPLKFCICAGYQLIKKNQVNTSEPGLVEIKVVKRGTKMRMGSGSGHLEDVLSFWDEDFSGIGVWPYSVFRMY